VSDTPSGPVNDIALDVMWRVEPPQIRQVIVPRSPVIGADVIYTGDDGMNQRMSIESINADESLNLTALVGGVPWRLACIKMDPDGTEPNTWAWPRQGEIDFTF
jgi:hypothetical protein